MGSTASIPTGAARDFMSVAFAARLGSKNALRCARGESRDSNLKLERETIVKNSLKLFAIALLAAFVLLASLLPQASRAKAVTARPTCGATVFGHVTSGGHHDTCPDDGKIVFLPGDHTTISGTDTCPVCGAPTTNGHSQAGG
jgi:hypothetical protein